MTDSFDVIMIGGGIVGLSAAIALRQRQVSVALLDAGSLTLEEAQPTEIDPRVYAINKASQQLFQSLGAWDLMNPARISPYQHMHVWDSTTKASIDFDARMIAQDRLGTILEESVIKRALLHQVSALTIPTFSKTRVSSLKVNAQGYCVTSDTGASWQAKLIIVADGAMSATRDLLGVAVTTWPYHHHAIVSTVRTKMPHQATAYQVFHPNGPLAFLPLIDPYQCSIVWSTKPDHVKSLMALEDKDFSDELARAFGHKLGTCTVIGKRYSFPLHMRHAKQYSGPGWVLMGDAAHTIHPLAGLGLNIGLADLAVFLELLGKDRLLSKKQLGAYHRQRHYEVWKMIALMGGLKSLFSSTLSPVASARGFGLQALDHMMPIKRHLIELVSG